MKKIPPEIARQIKAIRQDNRLPVSITMSFDTKCSLINQLTDTQTGNFFRPAPIASGDPDKFCGLPIIIDRSIPDGEVKVQ